MGTLSGFTAGLGFVEMRVEPRCVRRFGLKTLTVSGCRQNPARSVGSLDTEYQFWRQIVRKEEELAVLLE